MMMSQAGLRSVLSEDEGLQSVLKAQRSRADPFPLYSSSQRTRLISQVKEIVLQKGKLI
jgi:hypothetical protein